MADRDTSPKPGSLDALLRAAYQAGYALGEYEEREYNDHDPEPPTFEQWRGGLS